MPTRRQVVVLGLGQFGQAVAMELMRLGHDVLVVDRDERVVQRIADEVTRAVQADFTDPETLEALGLADFDTAIVSASETLEGSILATVLLHRIGVRQIIAKAAHDLHGSILEQVGATRVVHPEREIGLRVARSFHVPGVLDYFDAGPGYGLARITAAPSWSGQSIAELGLLDRYGLVVVALIRASSVTLNPRSDERLHPGEVLIVAGRDEDLERLPDSSATST